MSKDPEFFEYFARVMWAASEGDVETLRSSLANPHPFLKDKDAVNYCDWDNRTLLHVAASNGHEGVIRFLVNSGAKLTLRDKWKRTPLDEACIGGHITLVPLLQQSFEHDSSSSMVSDFEFDESPNPSQKHFDSVSDKTKSGDRLRLQELQSLLAALSEPSILASTLGIIEIFNPAACELFGYSQLEIVGQNISVLCSIEHRKVHDSYLQRYLQTGKRTIIGTAGRQVVGKHKEGAPLPILLSVSEMVIGETKYFIANVHDMRNIKSGRLGLDLCRAAGNGDLHTLKELLGDGTHKNAKYDVNLTDYDRRSALHLASAEGYYEIVEYLLSKRATVNLVDRWGGTPLQDALRARGAADRIVQLLVSVGGKIHEEDRFVELEESKLVVGDTVWEIDPTEVEIIPGRLGQGSFGIVHRGNWRGTTVAVKRLITGDKDKGVLDDFRSEVRVMKNLHHPNIVQFYGAFLRHQPYMLVTEFLPGGNLEDLQKKPKPVAVKRALQHARGIAAGMSYLHSLKPPIIHRDLKPANILLDINGVVKVADFGLAKVKHGSPNLPSYVMTGETGSYRYMAPEVFRHEKYTEKVDQYSFAIILWEMLEGTMYLPFLKAVDVARTAIEGQRPVLTRKVPAGVSELLEACWGDAEKRPTFDQICIGLDAIIEEKPEKCRLM